MRTPSKIYLKKAVDSLAKKLGYEFSWYHDGDPIGLYPKDGGYGLNPATYEEMSEVRQNLRMLIDHLGLEIQEGKRVVKKPKDKKAK